MVKVFALPFRYVLFEMSYANVQLYAASLPSYIPKDSKKTGDGKYAGTAYGDEEFKADDPDNAAKLDQYFATLRD